MRKKQLSTQLEKSLQALESLVKRLEDGEPDLEESLQLFEKGVRLAQLCQQALQEAEQKVDILQGEHVQQFTAPQALGDKEDHAA